ncbi:MAG TPA: sigma-70 family RNA polymerase sigma factor [Candidatus Merdivicinus excrementipullorum]|uniref:Sigma-70 family RNA polymerase sigma factor n=1 Tax=Candidatus Merdivicinus excrementipullorum TaxID=2840867 RepID=A0A9D1FN31_9FIRM|nr:sigma-70 family RNA polymerase sigma factor [Candidatus Merdivicinus excrementipullorum]
MFSQILTFLASHLLYFALHLDRASTFPKPLSAAQEQECFAKMAEGDKKARDMLIEHNLRLVAHVAKKYASGQTDTDDLLSIGTMGLMKAVSSFSYEKGTRFATYASRCIDNAILSIRPFGA